MNKKIKILFIHHASSWSGASNSMIKTIIALNKDLYEPTVLLIKDSEVRDKLEENGINYIIAKSNFYKKYYKLFLHWKPYTIPLYNLPKILKHIILWGLSRFIYAKRELESLDFDIYHLNSSQITDWLAPCKKKGKVIMHIREPLTRGLFGLRYLFFKSQMNKYTDKIIAISRDNLIRVGLPEKTEVVYNFSEVNFDSVDIESYKSKKVLYLGGAAKSKGFYTMVDSLKYLDPEIKVYFGGDYNIEEKKTIKLKIKKIIGYGYKNRNFIKKMRSHPSAIEIGMVYNVSKYFNETCCIVSPFAASHFARPVIEAYLHKKPAIGTNVEGMEEIIENNKTGILVQNNDPLALASVINNLTKNPEKLVQMGNYAYQVAIEKFTNKNIIKITNIYDKIL
jgi:glycosyltransferase involved in cell wall biosynthesis